MSLAVKNLKVLERSTKRQMISGEGAKSCSGARHRLLWKNRGKGPHPTSQDRSKRKKKRASFNKAIIIIIIIITSITKQ